MIDFLSWRYKQGKGKVASNKNPNFNLNPVLWKPLRAKFFFSSFFVRAQRFEAVECIANPEILREKILRARYEKPWV